jgi:hypothetical protein
VSQQNTECLHTHTTIFTLQPKIMTLFYMFQASWKEVHFYYTVSTICEGTPLPKHHIKMYSSYGVKHQLFLIIGREGCKWLDSCCDSFGKEILRPITLREIETFSLYKMNFKLQKFHCTIYVMLPQTLISISIKNNHYNKIIKTQT